MTGARGVDTNGPLRVTLHLPDGTRVTVHGQLLRQAHAQGVVALALAFKHPNQETEDRIHDAMLTVLLAEHRAANPAVLIVEPHGPRRAELAQKVAELGRRALPCAKPLHARALLDDPSERVDALLIRECNGECERHALLCHVAEHRRDIRPILLIEDPEDDPIAPHSAVSRCAPSHLPSMLS